MSEHRKYRMQSLDEHVQNALLWLKSEFKKDNQNQPTVEDYTIWIFAKIQAATWVDLKDSDYANIIVKGLPPLTMEVVNCQLQEVWDNYIAEDDYTIILGFLDQVHAALHS